MDEFDELVIRQRKEKEDEIKSLIADSFMKKFSKSALQ